MWRKKKSMSGLYENWLIKTFLLLVSEGTSGLLKGSLVAISGAAESQLGSYAVQVM